MAWIYTTFTWYFALLVLGIVFIPLTKKIFGGFFLDFGYPFSKVLALLLLTYAMFIGGIFKFIPFMQSSLILLIFLFVLFNGILLLQKRKASSSRLHGILLIVFEELLFIAALVFWTIVRGQEPSIRGLEKFMDFGFMNSILRSKFFPPLDMWLSADPTHPAGYPINYYYFGHLVGALLIRLTGVIPAAGYNLILSSIFAISVTQVFSLVVNMVYRYGYRERSNFIRPFLFLKLIVLGLVGSFIVNLGGNLHTIYAFTRGYPNDNPLPFWQILSNYNPTKYWYPNATRFIPFTIHEFPSYSYVVADLHGHVFDIPFILLTIAILFLLFIKVAGSKTVPHYKFIILHSVSLGFLTAVHFMTNAFDGPIYFLLTVIVLALLYKISRRFLIAVVILFASFVIFATPFTKHFSPFITGIGVNCSPQFLTTFGRVGPFLFEKDKCQISPLWMIAVLWGFFWVNFILFLLSRYKNRPETTRQQEFLNVFVFLLFSFGIFLTLIPEFFYIKDIYPAHFRANTMFKLGYQAFIMMGIASSMTIFLIKRKERLLSFIYMVIFLIFFFFVALYPSFSIPSYYGDLKRPVKLDGLEWMTNTFPQDKEIIDYLNTRIVGQPVVLEAQGDSYTDFERISANTGLPTIAGWWVHEWLWRGSSNVVGNRIPDVTAIYESGDRKKTVELLKKYHVSYVVISKMERQKYPQINERKFSSIGRLIFRSKDGFGALYQVN